MLPRTQTDEYPHPLLLTFLPPFLGGGGGVPLLEHALVVFSFFLFFLGITDLIMGEEKEPRKCCDALNSRAGRAREKE